MRINTEFLVFPSIHHATTSSDHNTTFYSQIPITPPYFYTFLKLALIARFAAVLWFNMVSAAVLGDISRSPKYFSVLGIGVPYSYCVNFYSTSVCFLPTYDFFAANRGSLCFKVSLTLLNKTPSALTLQERGFFLIPKTSKSHAYARCSK